MLCHYVKTFKIKTFSIEQDVTNSKIVHMGSDENKYFE